MEEIVKKRVIAVVAVIVLLVPKASGIALFGSVFVGALKAIAPLLVFVLVISSLCHSGKSIAAICKEYGIARNTFDRFRRQYTYTIIKGEKKRWRVNGNAAELKEKIHATL